MGKYTVLGYILGGGAILYFLNKAGVLGFAKKLTTGEVGAEAYDIISSGDPYNPSWAEQQVWKVIGATPAPITSKTRNIREAVMALYPEATMANFRQVAESHGFEGTFDEQGHLVSYTDNSTFPYNPAYPGDY